VTSNGLTIDGDVQILLAGDAVNLDIARAPDGSSDPDNLVRLLA